MFGRKSVIVTRCTEQRLIYEGSRAIPQSSSSAAAAPTCFDPTSATPDMCALSERQDLFSVDGKFISSEDGTTPTEFYNAILLFPRPPRVAYLCSGSALFLYTCWTRVFIFFARRSAEVEYISWCVRINKIWVHHCLLTKNVEMITCIKRRGCRRRRMHFLWPVPCSDSKAVRQSCFKRVIIEMSSLTDTSQGTGLGIHKPGWYCVSSFSSSLRPQSAAGD